MAQARGPVSNMLSNVAAIGGLVGLLLLGFAAVIVVMPTPLPQSAGSMQFLQRRLQGSSFGYITTTRAPSSFDSSDSSSSSDFSSEPSKSLESGSLESSDYNQLAPRATATAGSTMGPLTVWLILQVFMGLLYNHMVVKPIKGEGGSLQDRMDKAPDMEDGGPNDFNQGICECYKDKWVCLCGLCCPMLRMAHTNAVAGVCDFWESIACWCCCAWLTVGTGPCCLVMWWRLRLKNIMKVEEQYLNDFCLTMICPTISMCQVSSAVDSMMGYQMTGLWHYTPYMMGSEAMMGSQ